MLIPFWLVLVFVLGCIVGSFLNVCIARLPWEKSLLWPGSRCGQCFQPIRWYDNLPLVSYLWLRGRCRICQAPFSIRYFLVELGTGLGFAGLFYLEVVRNIHDWRVPLRWPLQEEWGIFPLAWWLGWGFHALLFALLLVASVCDLQHREIPLSLTLTGTLLGLVGAVLFAWPWPYSPEEALAPLRSRSLGLGPLSAPRGWWDLPPGIGPRQGLYPWPVWGPLPAWLAPGGNWQTGLATGLAGALAGTLVLRAVAFLFGTGLGKEALGLGDADLMMMVGSFLGWQPVLVAFLLSVLPALVFGLCQLLLYRDRSLPFGPALALGVLFTLLTWRWLGPQVQPLFFWPHALLAVALVGSAFLLGSSYLLRLLGRRREDSHE